MEAGEELLEPDPDAAGASTLESLVVLHVCLLGALLLMLPVLAAELPFLADDYALVAAHVGDDGHFDPASLLKDFGAPRAGVQYRPFFYLSFAFEYLLAGARPQLYYVMNALYHGVAAWLLFLLLRELSAGRRWALLSSLLFLCHPVHLEAVAWISARTATLGTGSLLAATLCFVRYRRHGGASRLVGLTLFAALGVGSRADVLVLPAILALADRLLLAGADRRGRRRWLPYMLVGLVFAAWMGARQLTTSSPLARWGTTLTELADPDTRARLWASLGRAVVPWVSSLMETTSATGMALVALPSVLLVLTGLLAVGRRPSRRLVVFGLAFAALGCLPLVPIMRVSEDLSSSRGLYLPSVGWCVLLGAAASAASSRTSAWLALPARLAIGLALVGGSALFVFNTQAYVLAGGACRDVLAGIAESGATVVVVPRSGTLVFADRFGDGVRNDGGVLFGPLSEKPDDEAGELVVLVNLPRMMHGVHLFWGDVRPAFGPLLGGPGVEVIYTDLPFGSDSMTGTVARLFGRLLVDDVPLLKWDGERFVPSEVVTVRDVSPLAGVLDRARVLSLGPLEPRPEDETFRLALPSPAAGLALFRFAAYTLSGVLYFAARPEVVGDTLAFDPWHGPASGEALDRARELALQLPDRVLGHSDRLPTVLFIEVVDFNGGLVARSEPVLWWLPVHGER